MIVKSCMMIEEVIYGPTPNMMIERLDKPPPEKIFKMPKNWLFDRNCESLTGSMPGIGIAAKTRKMIRAPKTKRILFRRLLSSQIILILFQIFCILFKFYFSTL